MRLRLHWRRSLSSIRWVVPSGSFHVISLCVRASDSSISSRVTTASAQATVGNGQLAVRLLKGRPPDGTRVVVKPA